MALGIAVGIAVGIGGVSSSKSSAVRGTLRACALQVDSPSAAEYRERRGCASCQAAMAHCE
jgi:hypothetical protein